jgi:hypothetical protein
MRAYLAGAALALVASDLAHADPRLDEKVYDPYVEPGVLELEVRSAGLVDAGNGAEQTSVFEVEYGLNKHLSLALVGVEGVRYLGRIPKLGVDSGLYFEYAHGLNGEPDKLEGKILLAKQVGRFEALANLIVERPLNAHGGGNDASYGYAASATWRTAGALRLGAEAVGNLGSDHGLRGRAGAYVGPELKWEFRPFGRNDADGDNDEDGDEAAASVAHHPIEIDIDAGWLAAVGPARNEAGGQVRVGIDVERKF